MRNTHNYCQECGEPISDRFIYCFECSQELEYDVCSCGNRKKNYHEQCKICFEADQRKIKREKFGFSVCPICGEEFLFSEFLNDAIQDTKTRLVANLITHYRHNHQKSWNYNSQYISSTWGEEAYQRAKIKMNNCAKRQILRKCQKWIVENRLSKETFLQLKDNDEKTLVQIQKTLGLNKELKPPPTPAL